ncbi:hypothetical protein [Methyloglobulus sp.]|uniref:hypothetical protein n=1 Tax=Methyloglobulus sp. TaxID=2518622 RepID=UPI003989C046
MTSMIARIGSLLRKSEQTYNISSSLAKVIVLAPFVIVFFSLLFIELPAISSLTSWLLSENRPVELLTFVSLLAAGLMGCKFAWRARKNESGIHVVGFYALFSAGLLIVAMEEVSWGQWIFGFEPAAAIKAINKQGELNLHNMPALHAPFEFLRVAFGLGGLFGVWLSSRPQTRDIGAPAVLSSWFVLVAILAALDLRNYYVPHSGQLIFDAAEAMVEVLELLIGLSAFLYMWLNGRRLSNEWKEVNT